MVRTRFAPSPTGFPHIGHLRTAVYAFALAKHSGGEFLLRIEDTDRKRYLSEGVDSLKNMLQTFGINWDSYFVQSDRKAQGIYQQAADKLVADGHAFYCQCQPKNAKSEGFSSQLRDPCRTKGYSSGAIKLKVPDGEKITYTDFVLDKEISWDTDKVYDATLLKSDGFPTYHLAAMVDDVQMQISHILRGHDWLPSTPIHLLVIKYLGGNKPEIGHLTDILSPQGGKLSKRKSSTTIDSFISEGYLPEAILNFVILLGWAPKDNRELFTLDEFVQYFDPKGFQKANPMFLSGKLDWFNGHYIRQKTDTDLTHLVKPYVKKGITDTIFTQITPLIKDRLIKLSDIDNLIEFFITSPKITTELFSENNETMKQLSHAANWLEQHGFSKVDLETGWTDAIKTQGWKVGDYFMALRIAICGSRSTPPITETMLVLGKAESLNRIENAIQTINTTPTSPS